MDDQPWRRPRCRAQAVKQIKGPPNRGGPTLTPRQATTLISRDAHSRGRCAICRSQLSLPAHVRAVRAGVRATSNAHHAPMQTEQRQPGRVRQRQESPKASRSPLSSPRIHEHQHIGRRGDQPEPNSSAGLAGPGRIRRVGKRTQEAPSAKRNGQRCKTLRKVPRRSKFRAASCRRRGAPARNISYWNHQIFCVNWSCFISPQGSHALCDGKMVRLPDLGIEPEET